jgi:hypothetical protein
MTRRRSTPRAPRSLAIAAAAIVLGCDRPSPSPSEGPAASGTTTTRKAAAHSAADRASGVAIASLDARAVDALRDAAVTDAAYAKRVLYSWTTREQAATLRTKKTLLLATELPSGPTPYVELLQKTAASSGPDADLARLLLIHPSLRLRRYAWSRPWPTRLGLTDRDYGDQLVRVVLVPDAVIARFDPTRPDAFDLRDLDERPVPLGEILASPARLAAVLHVRAGDGTPVAHREYVLCNESMVAEWSLATTAVREAIAEDGALLDTLARADLPTGPAAPLWHPRAADLDTRDPAALYATALAFDNDRYRARPENLRAAADVVRRSEQDGPPLVVTPATPFAFDAVLPNVRLRKPAVRIARAV